MKNTDLIVVDDIPWFSAETDLEGEKYLYQDINYKQTFLHLGKVYFLTADVYSIVGYTEKILTVFKKTIAPYIILVDRHQKRKVWFYQLPQIVARKNYEANHEQWLLSHIQEEIEAVKAQEKRVKAFKGNPVYLKLTLAYGVEIGGMVAHSTGVLSVLQSKYPQMSVFTTDYLPESINKNRVEHVSLKAFRDFPELRELFFNISAYRQIIDSLCGREVSFVYQRYSLHNFIGAMIAGHYQVPFILEYNSSSVWSARNWGNKLLYENTAQQIEMLNLEKAEIIICISDELKNSLVARGIDENKILVNYNGVDIKKYRPECSGLRVRKKLALEDKIVIGFSGSFFKFHGAEKLADAYGKLIARRPELRQQVYLMFIGDGGTRARVARKVREYKVNNFVKWVGTVAFEEVQDYLAACDILVAPHVPNKDKSPFFGSPTKLFEYMAMGKAIAASNLNQIGKILDGDCALLVEPGNSEELSRALETLVEDESLRRRLGENARKKVMAHYTWERHVERILERLSEVCQQCKTGDSQ